MLVVVLLAFALLAGFFADFHPAQGRFYDERFAFQNVHSVLQRGAFEPANGYYPTLSYLPQALVLGAVDTVTRAPAGESWIYLPPGPPAADANPATVGNAFSPLAYRMSRGMQIAWSVVSLLVLFALGRRAFGEPAGVVAVIVLATSPWFLTAAAKFKPDASLLATTLLALWLSVRAAERDVSWGAYAAAGAAIAAAMSCKLTGGLSAVPLTLVSFVQARDDRRRLFGLVVAGASSLALFLLANPHLRLYLHYMERLSAEYEDKAKAYDGTHFSVARRSLEMVVSDEGFGPSVGGLALVGFVVLGLALVRSESPLRRPAVVVPWLFVPVYLVAFAASTPHFKGNNVLSILPPLALVVGWLAQGVWRRLVPFAGRLRHPVPRILAVAIVAMAVIGHGSGVVNFAYQSVVPTTHDLARKWLVAEVGRGPLLLLSVDAPRRGYDWEGAQIGRVPEHARFPWKEAEVFREVPVYDGALGPPESIESSPWMSLPGARGTRIDPAWFVLRGPALAVRVRPWEPDARPVSVEATVTEGHFRVALPETLASGWYSVQVWVPRHAVAALDPFIEIAGERRSLAWLRWVGGGHLLSSPRFAHDSRSPTPTIEMTVPSSGSRAVAFALYRWRPPWETEQAPGED